MQTLDINAKQKVQYCIDLWLRDEQVKLSTARIKSRIEPYNGLRGKPIAIVCYGPSLKDTWERVKDFEYVMSCSGAHKFLLDRGIEPDWHLEVDPRAHKIQLIGEPCPRTEYVIASTCHPQVFDHLQNMNVKLWHVFDNDEDALRLLPRGEWAVTGGCSVGLRCLTMARFFGFTDLHIFGMDGSEGETGKHADVHPNQAPGHSIVEYKGKQYRTTTSFLEAAKQTWHELNQMPDVKTTFYGEGLVQDMAKDYVPDYAAPGTAIIGYVKPDLISSEYTELNRQLHYSSLGYGVGGGRHAATILKLSESLKTTSILDYGCGKGYLAKNLPFPIWEYDPAVEGKTEPPRPADIVVCTDVLEHIEPDKLVYVLDDLRRCTKKIGYFVISTRKASKLLADGRNAHLIVEGEQWWRKKLEKFFAVGSVIAKQSELHVVVGVKQAVTKHKNKLIQTI